LTGRCCEIAGASYVNVEIDVPVLEYTTISLNVTVPDPVGWRHFTVDTVVHDTVEQLVEPSLNDGVKSAYAKLLP
jgi:hypothetical protein